jgi:ferredoxin
MARLPVSSKESILSPECTGCLDCVAACPVKDALSVRTVGRRSVSPRSFATALLLIFMAGYLGARAAGSWQNDIPDREYVERVQEMDSPVYGHPGR